MTATASVICTDVPRLARYLSPEIITKLRDAGVKVVEAGKGEVRDADLVAQTLMNQSAKTYSEWMSERIKQDIRAAHERRRIAADAAGAGSGGE